MCFFYFSSTVSHFDRLASHVLSIICCVFVAPRFGGFATCRSNQQIRNLGFLQQSHFKCWSHHKSDGFWFGRICVSGHRCCIWCNCRLAWKGESVRPTDPDGSLTHMAGNPTGVCGKLLERMLPNFACGLFVLKWSLYYTQKTLDNYCIYIFWHLQMIYWNMMKYVWIIAYIGIYIL